MRDWNRVVEFYRSFLNDPRYAVSGSGMLDLVARLRVHPAFEILYVGTAHGALFFKLPDWKRSVHVMCDESGDYEICLDHGELSFYDTEITVNRDAVIDTLLAYLERAK